MRPTLTFLLFTLSAALCWATDAPAPAGNLQSQGLPTLFSRVRDLFGVDLPDIDPRTIKLILRPHFSDFIRRDYVRTEVGLRWAIKDNLEVSSEASTFLNHGLGDANSSNGIGRIHLGGKYIFPHWLRPDWEVSTNLNLDIPVGHPPLDMTDGLNHYSPGIVIQRQWKSRPKLTTFAGTSVDFVTVSDVPGTPRSNAPRDDSVSFTVGTIYNLGQIKWTLSGTYTNTELMGSAPEHFYYLRPSVLWYVPRKFTFNSKTQWIVGFGTPLTWGPDGHEFKVTTRLRTEITFRQVLRNMRNKTNRP